MLSIAEQRKTRRLTDQRSDFTRLHRYHSGPTHKIWTQFRVAAPLNSICCGRLAGRRGRSVPTCGLVGGLPRRRAPAACRGIGWSAKTRLCGHISEGLPDIVKEGPRLCEAGTHP